MTNRVYATIFLAVLVFAGLAQAQTFTTIYNFTGSDGAYPYAGVVRDSSGNLYGTTWESNAYGEVFRVNTAKKETVLHNFSQKPDGANPQSPVIRDSEGNIYGTTLYGGTNTYYGAVFKIDSAGNESVLASFCSQSECADGCYPYQGLARDEAGNLYGTTSGCGINHNGTIFEISSAGSFSVLHSFAGVPSDGANPLYGHLTMDSSGNLYGVTSAGGLTVAGICPGNGCGVLYELSASGTFTVLHKFAGGPADGCVPFGSVLRDAYGNLYGTTRECGSDTGSYGTIWKLGKSGKETILYNFAGGTDGGYPEGGVARDSTGNLYGVTSAGGAKFEGALYKLNTSGTLTPLHSFNGKDGSSPFGEVLRTTKGTLFGTTLAGGTGSCNSGYGIGCGTVWKYVP